MDRNHHPLNLPFVLMAIVVSGLWLSGPSTSWYTFTLLLCCATVHLHLKHRAESETNLNVAVSAATHEEHQLLLESIHHYPMPYAIYDRHDRLLVWNRHYEDIYAHTFDAVKNKLQARNMYYRDLVRSNASETLSGQALEDYVDKRVANHRCHIGSVVDREYPQYGWYRVSKYLTPSGGVAGIAIDINELKQRETELLQEVERRKKLEVKIRKLANTDSLTGVANRRHFIERTEIEFDRSSPDQGALCLMMLDIDNFKSVNDTYGHAAGDEVIATVASATASELTTNTDLIGRLGGEEFAVLLSGAQRDDGLQVAERIRHSIQSLSFLSDKQGFSVTVSVGIAYQLIGDTDCTALLKRADEALYRAKAAGRNRVELASDIRNDRNQAAG